MALATDRDLLALEPNVFRDIVFEAQTLVTASDGAVSGTTLTSSASDFASAGVSAGHVVMVDGAALEVVERLSATELSVSRLRAGSGALIPPVAGTGLAVRVSSFGVQIRESEARVMRGLGLTDAVVAGEVVAEALAGAGIVRLIALGALELVYAAASTRAEGSDPTWARSAWYGERASAELRRVGARLDSNADGLADAVRRVQPSRLVRE